MRWAWRSASQCHNHGRPTRSAGPQCLLPATSGSPRSPRCALVSMRASTPGAAATVMTSAAMTPPAAVPPQVRVALGRALEPSLLEQSATVIAGEHDFRAFSARTEPKPHYDCRIREARWSSGPAAMDGAFTWRRPLPAAHGPHVGGHHDRHRAWSPSGRRHGAAPGAHRQQRDEPAGAPAGLYFVRAAYPAEWFHADTTAAGAEAPA